MNHSPNFHRSFFAILVGNLIAILGSGIFALFVCIILLPDFYDELVQQSQRNKPDAEQKKAEPGAPLPKDKKGGPQDAGEEKEADKDEPIPDPAAPQPPPRQLKFPPAFLAIVLSSDLTFSLLAGLACVWIAGFARNNHTMLLCLFIGVWKIQQLLGTAENRLPSLLLTAEVLLCPLSCILGASFYREPSIDEEEDSLAAPENGFLEENEQTESS